MHYGTSKVTQIHFLFSQWEMKLLRNFNFCGTHERFQSEWLRKEKRWRNFAVAKSDSSKSDQEYSKYLCCALFFVCTISLSFFWNNKKLVRFEVTVHTMSSSSFHQEFSTSLTETQGKCDHRSLNSSFELISWLRVISLTRGHHLSSRHHCRFKSSVHINFRVSGSELSFDCQVNVVLEKSWCGKLTAKCFLNHGVIMWRYHSLKQLIDFDAQNRIF